MLRSSDQRQGHRSKKREIHECNQIHTFLGILPLIKSQYSLFWTLFQLFPQPEYSALMKSTSNISQVIPHWLAWQNKTLHLIMPGSVEGP